MNENVLPPAGPSSPARPVPADRLLSKFAEILDVAAVQQQHPEWNRERLCSLLRTAADHLRSDEHPTIYQRLSALLPICATFLAGHLLLLFGRHIKDVFDSFEAPVSSITRLALAAANLKSDPVKVLCGAMLVICFGWAWWSPKRLRWFVSWTCILVVALGLAYLLVCLYPLLSLWLHAGRLESSM